MFWRREHKTMPVRDVQSEAVAAQVIPHVLVGGRLGLDHLVDIAALRLHSCSPCSRVNS